MKRMVLQHDIKIETSFKENLFLFNGGFFENLDYAFFVKILGNLGKLNRNKEIIFDNNWDDWTPYIRLGFIHN